MLEDIKYGLFKYDVKDYYAILGVPIDANAKQVRLRYLKIAYNLHPDTCKSSDQSHKKKASQILSKLVNPAYENLYKDKARRECELIFRDVGKTLAADAHNITIATETAKKLWSEEKKRDKLYKEYLDRLSTDQYEELDKILTKIALISELNMVYLMAINSTQTKSSKQFATTSQASKTVAQTNPTVQVEENTSNVTPESEEDPSKSRLLKLISNAEEHKQEGNIEQAILDLRDALKLDPNNSYSHALIGSLYFEQNNLPYAKIHVKKSLSLNPNEKLAKEIDEKVNSSQNNNGKKSKDNQKSAPKSDKTKKKATKSKSDKKKKEAPKIFGIPLW